MPIPTATGGSAARPRRPGRTSLRKQAREAKAAARAALDAAVRTALRRAPRTERLRAALQDGVDDARLVGDLAPYRGALRLLHGLTTEATRAAVTFLCDVEARAPGLLLARVHDRHRVATGLIRLAPFLPAFVRPLSTWSPPSRRPARVWTSLVQHVLGTWPVPPGLDLCLVDQARPCELAAVVAEVGSGRSVRALGLPCVVTRAVAHALTTSSEGIDTAMALVRDAQARATGLGPAARHVVRSRWSLQRFLEDEEGLFAAFAFLARHPEMTADEVGVVCDGLAAIDGRLPSMKGRSARSLLTLCREAVAAARARTDGRVDVGPLPPSPFAEGRYVLVGDERFDAPTFVVKPLQTGRALVDEGLAMRHCVGTYAERAKKGEVVIVAVGRCLADARVKRALTLEVSMPARAVVQVRGKANRRATTEEVAVVRCWAGEQGLAVAPQAW